MKKLVLITVILAFAANTFVAGAGIAGGRIQKTTTGYEITYFITDHLGSTRVVTTSSGEIKEQNDYYPFGKKHENPDLMTSTNRYLFSGKEKQTTAEINYMDFGYRMYDDFLGRWFTHDPQSYRRPWESPYGYCGGNPVVRVDPDGQVWWLVSLVSGAISWVSNGLTIGHWGIKSFLVGAASGLVGAGVGMAVTSLATSWGIGSGLAGVIGSTAGGAASGALGSIITGGNIGQGALYGGIGGLAGGATSLATKDMRFWERLGLSSLSGGVVSGVFAEAQGGKFWNGFAAGAGGAAAGFLGNELGEYIEETRAETKYLQETLGLSDDEMRALKRYGLGKIKTWACIDDEAIWEQLIGDHRNIKMAGVFEKLRSIDIDKSAILKTGKWHVRYGTKAMVDGKAYEMSTGHISIHYDRFDVILNPVLHILFDSLYQLILGVQ
jgi:RHS repeat-associated protein